MKKKNNKIKYTDILVESTDMLYFVFFFFVALIAWYYWRWENSFFVRQIDNIPGPLKLPLYGNIFAFPRDGPGKTNDLNQLP